MGYIIIIVIIILIIVNSNKNTSSGGSGTSRAPSKNGRGQLLDMSGKLIVSFKDGVVYYRDDVAQLGRYGSDGRVYNKSGDYIGRVMGDSAVMDRTYSYEWLQRHLTTDPAIHDPNCKPAMTMEAGIFCSSCIETPEEERIVFVDGAGSDPIGANAAYLVGINDGLINKALDDFYLTSNVQQDCYFIKNNGRGMAYTNYFKQRYGRPFWSLN